MKRGDRPAPVFDSQLRGDRLSIDVHAHLVPSMDEGSRSLAESLVMAQTLERLGVARVHVTPHQFRMGNDRSNDELRAQTDALRDHLRGAGLRLEVVASAEYLYGERWLDALLNDEALMTWTAGTGGAAHVLVELPLREPVVGVERSAELLRRRGVQPVMAHPERVEQVLAEPRRVLLWRDAGWRFQLDLLSLVGAYGRRAQGMAGRFLAEGLYDYVGSDLHRSVQCEALVRAHDEFHRLTSVDGGSR